MCKNLFLLLSLISALTYAQVTSGDRELPIIKSGVAYPTSCLDVLHHGYNVSDMYVIQPVGAPEPFLVFCDMETSGGGWTTILNRVDGSQNFTKYWTDYKLGFGNFEGEFWLGLEKIYYMTRYEVHELLLELVDWNETQKDARYNYFAIGSEEQGYMLDLLGDFGGSAGDSLTYHAGMKFSTIDKDQDEYISQCSVLYRGGWWYKNCHVANPTGEYYADGVTPSDKPNASGICWYTWHGYSYGLKEVRMMIRRK